MPATKSNSTNDAAVKLALFEAGIIPSADASDEVCETVGVENIKKFTAEWQAKRELAEATRNEIWNECERLKEKIRLMENAAAIRLVDCAIAENKIPPEKRDAWLAAACANMDAASAIIATMPKRNPDPFYQ